MIRVVFVVGLSLVALLLCVGAGTASAQGASSSALTLEVTENNATQSITVNALHEFDAAVETSWSCRVDLFGCVATVGDSSCGKLVTFARKTVKAGKTNARFRATTLPILGTESDQRQINLQTRALCRQRGAPKNTRVTIVSDAEAHNITCESGVTSNGRFVRNFRRALRR